MLAKELHFHVHTIDHLLQDVQKSDRQVGRLSVLSTNGKAACQTFNKNDHTVRGVIGWGQGDRPIRESECGELHPTVTHPAVILSFQLEIGEGDLSDFGCRGERKGKNDLLIL